ncbi:MAG: IS110 family transposase [Acidimicrobiales bacterium]
MVTIISDSPRIVVGVDSHKETHQVAVLDRTGALMGNQRFAVTRDGYRELEAWLATMGTVDRVGVECTGSFAAGLTRFFRERGVDVYEVTTTHRATRARRGKDDMIDAEMAARKVLSGEARAVAKDTTGDIESIRLLKLSRESAVKARTVALLQIRDVLITAPAELREWIESAGGSRHRVNRAGAMRPDLERLGEPLQAAKFALRQLSRRVKMLDEEIAGVNAQLDQLVARCAPHLLQCCGIGTQHAAQLLITAGQHLERLQSDGAFARLCGVAPVPVSSGKTNRMRLHRGGDRQANRALHLIAIARLRLDPKTQVYMARRRAEGLSNMDVVRCLKRFIAREVYNALKLDLVQN